MIKKNPAHYFECVLPRLEDDEEEIWFPHPVLDVKCNQLGILVFDEVEFSLLESHNKTSYLRQIDLKTNKYIVSAGTKANLAWECYHQRVTNSRIIHKNHNEWDFTMPNLYSPAEETPYEKVLRYKQKREWETRSAEVLLEKETSMAAKGLDKDTYRAFLMLPSWLTTKADSLV